MAQSQFTGTFQSLYVTEVGFIHLKKCFFYLDKAALGQTFSNLANYNKYNFFQN